MRRLGFSLQANAKTREGSSDPDRHAQFEHINAEVKAFQTAGDPVISVDTKKKELCLSGCHPYPLHLGCCHSPE